MPDQSNSKNKIMNSSSQKVSSVANSTGISSSDPQQAPEKTSSKIMITGDDILIEYVARIVNTLHQLQSDASLEN